MKSMLGPANLSTFERLSTFWRLKHISNIGKSSFGVLDSVLCREVFVSFVEESFNRGSTVCMSTRGAIGTAL